jgi:diguanylate cyclase (GGDEF)-like protein/PAS domain S-box-containing protein
MGEEMRGGKLIRSAPTYVFHPKRAGIREWWNNVTVDWRFFMKPEEIDPQKAQNLVPMIGPGFYKELLDNMSDGVYFVDRERRIVYWNEGASRLTGYAAEDILGKHCQDDILCHVDLDGKHLCQEGCPLSASIDDGGEHQANVFLRHQQGRRVPVSVRVQPLRAADGSITGAVEIFSDNSAEMEAQRKTEEMRRMTFLDYLTGLPNRRFLDMSLDTARNEYEVHGEPFAVLTIDVDKFKEINDTFGHSDGDLALQQVAKTLVGSLRPTDTVGRWGGDEFLAIVRNVDEEIHRTLVERCVFLVAETLIVSSDGRPLPLSISVGATLAHPEDDVRSILHRADKLLYLSKSNGRGRASIG